MVCIDNSEYTRNGDYTPNRMASIKDAANMLCTGKCNQNPESAVGVLAMAGERVQLVATPSPDQGRILGGINSIKVTGVCNLIAGIKIGQLALKHRMNKNQRQRICVFVASPITATVKELENLGKNLKKNNVSIDLISIGEVEENKEKIAKLHEAANSNGTSNILEVEPGMTVLSNAMISSTIMHPDGAPPAGAGGDGGFGFGGMEENDPELAMALRISMEEERARTGGGDAGGSADAPAAAAPSGDVGMAGMDDDMDEELRQALAMSLAESQPSAAPETPAATTTDAAQPPAEKKAKTEGADAAGADDPNSNLFLDESFVKNFLGTLPGVDVNDAKIQDALRSAGGATGSDDKGDDKDKDKKKKEEEDKDKK